MARYRWTIPFVFFFCIFQNFLRFIWLDNVFFGDEKDNVNNMNISREKTEEFGIARFPNGTLGLIIDPSWNFLRNQSTHARNKSCVVDRAIDHVAFEVFKLIRIGVIRSRKQLKGGKRESSTKILCIVYTHSRAHSRIEAIVNTWGSQCDGFFAASNVTDLSIGTIDLVHKGPETYNNMWQKVRSILKYTYDNFLDDYDYFHISGDDSFVVVDNMRNYLQGQEIQNLLNGHIDNFSKPHFNASQKWKNMKKGQSRPLLLGVPLMIRNEVFPQGGSGYTLNREALRLIGDEDGPLYTVLTEETDPREDLFIAALLSKVDTYISDTRDTKGAFRYIPYQPKRRARGRAKYPKKYRIFPILSGMDLFSNETVALHLRDMDSENIMMDEIIYRTHDIINGACD